MRTCSIRIAALALGLLALSGAQSGYLPAKKEQSESELRELRAEHARASRESHRIAAEKVRKTAELLDLLRIRPHSDSCFAYDKAAAACVVSLEQFNRSAESLLPDTLEKFPETQYPAFVRKARALALDAALEDAYISAMKGSLPASSGLPGPDAESPRSGAEGSESRDASLRARFRETFPALIAADGHHRVKVIASSDSLFLDSLLNAGAGRSVLNTVAPQTLPDDLVRALIGLKPGYWSSLRKTSFGFAAVSPAKAPPVFESARGLLSSLDIPLTMPDSVLERWGRAYYLDHPLEFRARDTLELGIRLVPRPPGFKAPREIGCDFSMAPDPPAGHAKRAPIRALSSDLPASIETFLSACAEKSPGDSVGPVPLDYGIWTFHIHGRRKGREPISFEQARPHLEAKWRELELSKRIRDGLSQKQAKSRNQANSGARWALIQELESHGSGASPEASFRKSKSDWIRSNIRLVYDIER